MKRKILFLLPIIFTVFSCGDKPNKNSQISEIINNSSSSYSYTQPDTNVNYHRALKTIGIIEDMYENIATIPGDEKKAKLITNLLNDEDNFIEPIINESKEPFGTKYYHYDNDPLQYGEPEIKGLTEPLGYAFSLITYYLYHGEPNFPVLEKSFYEEQYVYDSETQTSTKQYKKFISVRDIVNSDEKIIYIDFEGYVTLIHLAEDGHFNTLSVNNNYHHKVVEELDGGFRFEVDENVDNINIIASTDYKIYSEFVITDDFKSETSNIYEHYRNKYLENDMPTGVMLLDLYFGLHALEDNQYDFDDLLAPKFVKNLDEIEDAVDITQEKYTYDSYLDLMSIFDTFMIRNYFEAGQGSSAAFYDIQDNIILSADSIYRLFDVPEGIIGIEDLFEFWDDQISKSGAGLLLPSSLDYIKDEALTSNAYNITHIFIEQSKDECPFKEQLEKYEDIEVFYKGEFTYLGKIPLPLIEIDEEINNPIDEINSLVDDTHSQYVSSQIEEISSDEELISSEQ